MPDEQKEKEEEKEMLKLYHEKLVQLDGIRKAIRLKIPKLNPSEYEFLVFPVFPIKWEG
jgi:hypothetical protein